MKNDDFHWMTYCQVGSWIDNDEAESLEQQISTDPSNKIARAKLLGYYSARENTRNDERKQIEHILWVLEHEPKCGLGVTPALHISKLQNPIGFAKAKEIALRQAKRFRRNSNVLTDIGSIFRGDDPEFAVSLLRRAYKISNGTNRDRVAFWLSMTLACRGRIEKNQADLIEATKLMKESIAQKRPTAKIDFRTWLAKLALEANQFATGAEVANEMLSDNSQNDQSVHVACNVLGTISFQQGDVRTACERLIQAGRVNGGHRLRSYGPMMKLAQKLLDVGQKDAVLRYLNDCKSFWEMGQPELAQWIIRIEAGETPQLEGDD